eukprot:gb/GFBE01036293.1/.p1 GENE.gb/GFBE01036293.1/~~gb/GFBE01036293.1/.p1  ORF type:complete len:804 (+),score=244.68 gb/GFBE01036293.1/:1-2412(+)
MPRRPPWFAAGLHLFVLLAHQAANAAQLPPEAKHSLLQKSMEASEAEGQNPLKTVVSLMEAMSKTLQQEADEDQKRHDDLACWCQSNKHENTEMIESSTARISELESSIDSLHAEKTQLDIAVKGLDAQIADGQKSLAEASSIRDDQHTKFAKYQSDSSTYIKSLKAAVIVLTKQAGLPALPQVSHFMQLVSNVPPSLLQLSFQELQESDSEAELSRSLDDFMRHHGFAVGGEAPGAALREQPVRSSQQPVSEPQNERIEAVPPGRLQRTAQKFLQRRDDSADDLALIMEHAGQTFQTTSATPRLDVTEWSEADKATIQTGLSAAAAFMQATRGQSLENYSPSSSGELVGMLKQMGETMEDDLKEAAAKEDEQIKEFDQMKLAKLEEIGAAQSELYVKKDEHSHASEALSLAKADVKQETKLVKQTREALANLERTCMEGDHNFKQRQEARAKERQAVDDAITILSEEASPQGPNFIQLSEVSVATAKARAEAAQTLREVSARLRSSENSQVASNSLEVLASSAELDSFKRVKEAIDSLVREMKRKQTADNNKKDRCNQEFLENAKDTEKAADHQTSLEIKAEQIESDVKVMEDDLKKTKAEVQELEKELQIASLDRQKEQMTFQRTYWDQAMTIKALKKAKAKLSAVYGKEALIQVSQDPSSPPVKGVAYKKHGMGSSVLDLLQSLIEEANQLVENSATSENEAEASYGKLVKTTKDTVDSLQVEITMKSKAIALAKKDLTRAHDNVKLSAQEQEDLATQNNNLKLECDFLLNNFDKIRAAREEELEALAQAKSILSGASLG